MTDAFPPLRIEYQADGLINLIDPTEDGSGNVWAVLVHPAQLRTIAERLGLTTTSRGPSVAELQRESDRLKRNLLRLREHALSLQHDFANNADWKHADLTHEMNNINALVSLFDMACDDFAADYDAHVPGDHSASTREHATRGPKTDGFEAPPKTGALSVAARGQLALEV